MKVDTDLVERVEFSIPNNRNTRSVLKKIRDTIVEYFDGATRIRSQLGGLWLDKKGEVLDEDIILFIIYYNSEEYPKAEEILKYLARMLIETGEEASWLIYQQAKRMRCVESDNK